MLRSMKQVADAQKGQGKLFIRFFIAGYEAPGGALGGGEGWLSLRRHWVAFGLVSGGVGLNPVVLVAACGPIPSALATDIRPSSTTSFLVVYAFLAGVRCILLRIEQDYPRRHAISFLPRP